MNKTISINIGGAVFNIEEEAFQKLKQYLDRIKLNFAGDPGESEIMADIEGRIAELFSQRMENLKNVVELKDVEEVIAIMGQPEDFGTGEQRPQQEPSAGTTVHDRRRIYRDEDDAFIGGVCSGLSYLLGWDPIILRIAFILLIFTGSGIPAYLILWIVVPAARTTAEKLRMRGEPVTVENISRFVSREAKAASERVNRWGDRVNAGMQKTRGLGNNFGSLLKRFIGLVLILFSVFALIGLTTGALVANTELLGNSENFQKVNELIFQNDGTLWMLITGGILVFAVPVIGMLYLGVRLLVETEKRIRGFGWGLLILFIAGVILSVMGGGRIAKEFRRDSEIKNVIAIQVEPKDTLSVVLSPDTTFKGRSYHRGDDFMDLIKKEQDRIVFGSDIHFSIRTIEPGEQTRIEVERSSNGSSLLDAGDRASRIRYDYTWEDKTLTLGSVFTTPANELYRGQSVRIRLYVPEGTPVRLSANMDWISGYRGEAGRIVIAED